MKTIRMIAALVFFLGYTVTAGGVLADTVLLKNGDVLNGEVLSLDANELKLRSDVLGQVSLAREKIVTIHLGDQPLPLPAASAAGDIGASQPPSGAATAPLMAPDGVEVPKADSVEDIVRQLRLGGVDAETLEGLQDQVPLLATPEVRGYFDEKVRGLMTGNLTIQDIRKDAINARDQIRELQRDLPQADDALNPYLSILEAFIRKTEPIEPIRPRTDETPAADPEAQPNEPPSER